MIEKQLPTAQLLALQVLKDAKNNGTLDTSVEAELAELVSGGTRPAVGNALSGTGSPAPAGGTGEALTESSLAKFKTQYESLPAEAKQRMAFEAVAAKLLANDGEKLKLAENMQGGGHLFRINGQGEVLFRDKGHEPVMYGFDEGDKLIQIYDRRPEDMQKVRKWADYHEIRRQVLEDGYEMFRDDGDYGFSDDMKHASAVNEKGLFVASVDKKQWRVSWLESGENPAVARDAVFGPDDCYVSVDGGVAGDRCDRCGVVRLLRV